jgi:hypothetical protein
MTACRETDAPNDVAAAAGAAAGPVFAGCCGGSGFACGWPPPLTCSLSSSSSSSSLGPPSEGLRWNWRAVADGARDRDDDADNDADDDADDDGGGDSGGAVAAAAAAAAAAACDPLVRASISAHVSQIFPAWAMQCEAQLSACVRQRTGALRWGVLVAALGVSSYIELEC